MPLIKCPNCGRDISDKAKKCIGCGYVLAMNIYSTNVIKNESPIDENSSIQSEYTTNTPSIQKENENTSLNQEKILAFSKLMQDGIITSNELAKIINVLCSDVSSNVTSNDVSEKTPLEKKYDECFSKYIINAFKSPSTCKWPKLESNMIVKGSIKINSVVTQCTYIDTYIDAANSYGAMLRQKIRLVLDDQGNITRALQELQTSGITLLGAIANAANKDNWTDIVHFKTII